MFLNYQMNHLVIQKSKAIFDYYNLLNNLYYYNNVNKINIIYHIFQKNFSNNLIIAKQIPAPTIPPTARVKISDNPTE